MHVKRLGELTTQDLLQVPVWRYVGTTEAEALVEPTDLCSLSEDADGVYLVRTVFTLSDGTVAVGYCTPTDDSGLDYVQPVLLTGTGHVPLFREVPASSGEPESTCRRLAKPFDRIFPIRYRAEIPVDGHFVHGEVRTVLVAGHGTARTES
jgi:hypothetical protein